MRLPLGFRATHVLNSDTERSLVGFLEANLFR